MCYQLNLKNNQPLYPNPSTIASYLHYCTGQVLIPLFPPSTQFTKSKQLNQMMLPLCLKDLMSSNLLKVKINVLTIASKCIRCMNPISLPVSYTYSFVHSVLVTQALQKKILFFFLDYIKPTPTSRVFT